MSDELKPCSFCNGEGVIYEYSTVETCPCSMQPAQPAEAEGVSNARLMNTLAELARRAPLRTLQTICETQHQVSTVKLERYLEPIGDTLAGYAFTLRIDFDKLSAALSAVTAERDRLQKKWARVESERDQLRAELETVKKVAYGNLELLDENAKLRAEAETLRALLSKSLPVVEAHAGASHMLEGFRPIRNKWDELVDGIRAAMSAKEA